MSDTPQMDGVIANDNGGSDYIANLARKGRELERELTQAELMIGVYKSEVTEAIRQVEASDNLYRKMCKERDELKADVRRLSEAILNAAVRHAAPASDTTKEP